MRILLPLLLGFLSLPVQAIDLNGIAEFDHRLTLNSSISARVARVMLRSVSRWQRVIC